jgi:ArsR family transcriptional regulator, virulence genes transcriptional regulator
MKFTDLEAPKIDKAADLMKAIAHPVRLSILGYLSDGEEFSVTRIHELLKIEQSTASHHLGVLKDKGVLNARREGKNKYYSLRNKNLRKLVECISMCACIDD